MSTEPESFLSRWSRRKRAAEREAVRPADGAAPELPAPAAKVDGEPVAGDAPAASPASVARAGQATEVPLPSIESLDGLRSDYQAFFSQPVDDELRHAALKKLFADPHFNQMDMLDVYVDDYTQFEPLPAALRLRLPSARAFLLDSERAELDALDAANAVDGASKSSVVQPGAASDAAASAPASDDACGVAGDGATVDSTSGRLAAGSPAPVAPADAEPLPSVPSLRSARTGKSS